MGTLLQQFIREKLEAYQEPSRAGTPRGEPIGLSKVKYQAALFVAVTEKPLIQVAKESEVGYGVLRKWTCEDGFKEAVEKLRREFVGCVQEYLLRLVDAIGEHGIELVRQNWEVYTRAIYPKQARLDALSDLIQYSKEASAALHEWAETQQDSTSLLFILMLSLSRGLENLGKFKNVQDSSSRRVIMSMIQKWTKRLLGAKDALDSKTTKEIVVFLALIAIYLKSVDEAEER